MDTCTCPPPRAAPWPPAHAPPPPGTQRTPETCSPHWGQQSDPDNQSSWAGRRRGGQPGPTALCEDSAALCPWPDLWVPAREAPAPHRARASPGPRAPLVPTAEGQQEETVRPTGRIHGGGRAGGTMAAMGGPPAPLETSDPSPRAGPALKAAHADQRTAAWRVDAAATHQARTANQCHGVTRAPKRQACREKAGLTQAQSQPPPSKAGRAARLPRAQGPPGCRWQAPRMEELCCWGLCTAHEPGPSALPERSVAQEIHKVRVGCREGPGSSQVLRYQSHRWAAVRTWPTAPGAEGGGRRHTGPHG